MKIILYRHNNYRLFIAHRSCVDDWDCEYPSGTKRFNTVAIVGIIVGCAIFFLVIVSVSVCLNKRVNSSTTRNAPSLLYPNDRTQAYPMAGTNTRVTRQNTPQTPFNIQMHSVRNTYYEGAPPPYELAVSSLTAHHQGK